MRDLSGKKIAVLGLGVNNQKLADFLSEKKIPFDVIEGWQNLSEIADKVLNYDIIFRTPGIPFVSPIIQNALSKGVEVSSQTKFFFELCPCPIIGVTGTKGKGTTSSLIYEILKTAGRHVWLAGNIGKDPFEFLDQLRKEDLVVLELSSFQLQDLQVSPHIAVVLNITTDHVNPKLEMATHYNQDEYVKAKSSIVAYQNENDFAVIHPNLPDWFKNLGNGKKIQAIPDNADGYETKLIGKHNKENIAAALAVAKIFKIDDNTARQTVKVYKPLPHRLQIVSGKNDITYVDDSISTNVDSTIAAIEAFNSNVVLIVGGFDKGHDYTELGNKIKSSKNISGLVIVGQVTQKILDSVDGYSGKILTGATDMKTMVMQANSLVHGGDTILLSPAAASFDMFKDAKDRGEQFIQNVT